MNLKGLIKGTICLLAAILVLAAGNAWAGTDHAFYGYCWDAPDGTPADGSTATFYVSIRPTELLYDIVGATGLTGTPNAYMENAGNFPTSWSIGELLIVEIDNGAGYTASTSMLLIGDPQQFPDITLAPSAPPPPTEVWVDDDYCDTCGNDGHIWGYDAFDNIQDGIDAVSASIVHVAPGTYYEVLTINKANLTVQSTGGKANPIIDAGGAAATVVNINADSVTFSGFTLQNASGFNVRGIDMAGPISGCNISDIVIKDLTTTGDVYAVSAVQVNASTFSNLAISNLTHGGGGGGGAYGIGMNTSDNNTFTVTAISDFTSEADAQGVLLNNNCDGNSFTSTGISDLTSTSGCPCGITIWERDSQPSSDSNTFTTTTISNLSGASSVYGIQNRSLSGVGYEHIGNKFTGTTISNLASTGPLGDAFVCGIYNEYVKDTELRETDIDSLISSGEVAIGFNNNVAENTVITRGEIQDLSGVVWYKGVGINVLGSASTASIEEMAISQTNVGITISGSVADLSQVSVHYNSIAGNTDYGLMNHHTGTVDASGNWWGDASGPSTAKLVLSPTKEELSLANPSRGEVSEMMNSRDTYRGDEAVTISEGTPMSSGAGFMAKGTGDALYGSVDYTPWLHNPDQSADPGFQADLSYLHVDDSSPQTGTKAYIEEGIDMVTGSTVEVEPGTYYEVLTINKANLTVQSSGGAASTIIDAGGTDNDVVSITADNVTLTGFTLQNAVGVYLAGILMTGTEGNPISGCTISDITIKNITGDDRAQGIRTNYVNTSTFSDVRISDLTETAGGTFSGAAAFGICLAYQSHHNTFIDVGISNLVADTDAGGIFLYSECDHNTFTNTVISGLTGTGCVYGVNLWAQDPNPPSNNNTFTTTTISNLNSPGSVYGIQHLALSGGEHVGNKFIHTHISGLTSAGDFTCGIYNEYTTDAEFIDTDIRDLNTPLVVALGFNNNQAQNLLISGGTIQDLNTPPPSVWSAGINILGPTSTATITGMTISGAARGIRISSSADASQISVHYNSISGNTHYGLLNEGAKSIVDAEYNWWGSVDGPEDLIGSEEAQLDECYDVSTMVNAVAELSGTLGDKVSENADYCPWLGGDAGFDAEIYAGCNDPCDDFCLDFKLTGTDVRFFHFKYPLPTCIDLVSSSGTHSDLFFWETTMFGDVLHIDGSFDDPNFTGANVKIGEICFNHDGTCENTAQTLTCTADEVRDGDGILVDVSPGLAIINVDNTAPTKDHPGNITPCYSAPDDPDWTCWTLNFYKGAQEWQCELLRATIQIYKASGCGSGDLVFTNDFFTTPISGDYNICYPTNQTERDAIWAATHTAHGDGIYYVELTVWDNCCNFDSNCDAFTFCIDTETDNYMTCLDAMPAHNHICLEWNYDFDATNAVKLKILRSPYRAGNYPVYAASDPVPTGYNDPNWYVLYEGTDTYPCDQLTWFNDDGEDCNGSGTFFANTTRDNRDIYWYAGFTQDAAGNWSDANMMLGTGADRATSYWLGDVTDIGGNLYAYDGQVLGSVGDVHRLSVVYGSPATADPEVDYGPETQEHGIGRGIPMPDNVINYKDLLPLSFNYNIVGPSGDCDNWPLLPGTNPPRQLNKNVDEIAAVWLKQVESNHPDGITFALMLTNPGDATHLFHSRISYNTNALSLMEVRRGEVGISEGFAEFFGTPITGNGLVDVDMAALGPDGYLIGSGAVAYLDFSYEASEMASVVRLEEAILYDGEGNEIPLSPTDVEVENQGEAIPTEFALHHNHPNPFNPTTIIKYDLPQATYVKLVVYNVRGQKVATLVDGLVEVGHQQVVWNAKDISSGIYFYKITAGNFTNMRKMILLK